MSGLILRATELAQLLLALAVHPGDTVIDATAGQGRDTCFLAALVGKQGQVWAFDIQEQACQATRLALEKQGLLAQARIIQGDHAHISSYEISPAAAAVFNLGWLPGGDHNLVSGKSTLAALKGALDKLKPGGIMVVTAYPGHEAGAAELADILAWLKELPAAQAQSMEFSFPGKQRAPVVILLEKPQSRADNSAQISRQGVEHDKEPQA